MLTMKVMLWWAQKCGAEGLAWSSADLQQQRWQGCGPPDLLYRKLLPEAGLALSKALPLRLATASLRIRGGGRVVERSVRGWDVCGQHGQKLTKAFRDRGQDHERSEQCRVLPYSRRVSGPTTRSGARSFRP